MDLLTQHAHTDGSRPAVIVDASGGARPSATSYAELESLANRLARTLVALGARPGDRIAWCGPNSLEVLTLQNAARKADLNAVPVSYRLTAHEIQYVVDNSDAVVGLYDTEQTPLVANVRDQLLND